MRKRSRTGLATGLVAVVLGCAPSGEGTFADGDPTIERAGEPTQRPPVARVELPGTGDAAEIWGYLADIDYRGWPLWPGRGERYPGGEPHGSTLTTYLNPPALEALEGGAPTMPEGAIIVKENYAPSGELAAITTMYKVDGYNPAAADWHWVKFLPDGSVDNGGAAQGIVPGCIACHTGVADNDYIFTGRLGGR